MSPVLLPLVHLGAGLLLLSLPPGRLTGLFNLLASLIGAGIALALVILPPPPAGLLFIDALNRPFLALAALIGVSTAWYNLGFLPGEITSRRLSGWGLRLYHPLFQMLQAALMLALLADNLGLLWAAIEGATLATILMVALSGTPAALAAARRAFLLGSAGIALALFGTLILYIASQKLLGPGLEAISWSHIAPQAARLSPALTGLSFVFILIGYGTKAGLVPMQSWLPDAHAEGPTPIAAVLSGLMLSVALYAIVRLKVLTQSASIPPGIWMIGFGLLTVIAAALMLPRRVEVRRFFATSSIEQMGLATLAFGLGGVLAGGAALWLMVSHMLAKSAIFFLLGRAIHLHGDQPVTDLIRRYPAIGWLLTALVLALIGLPPFAGFMPKIVLLSEAARLHPALGLLLAAGVLAAAVAILHRLTRLVFLSEPAPSLPLPGPTASLYGPVGLHLLVLLLCGIGVPARVGEMLSAAAEVIR